MTEARFLSPRDCERPMHRQVDAIYEDGVLKPLTKLELPEHSRVQLTVQANDQREARLLPEWPRHRPADMHLANPVVNRAAVLAELAKISGSVVEEFRQQREGRF
jgi:predicted DNA-binding antitoxin AbrB/MazE fold protein